MDNFQMGVLRNQKAVAKKLNAKATDTFGPPLAELYSTFQGILGLRGLWWPGNVTVVGNLPDMSGQGNALVDNVAGAVSTRLSGMLPIYPFNGTTQYISGASATWNQILGTEGRVTPSSRGLTLGGWFFNNSTAPANFKGIMSRWNDNAVNQRSYLLAQTTTGHFQAYVSGNGTNQFSVDSNAVPVSGWHFIIGRYTPSTELAIFDNYDGGTGIKVTNTTTIPASLFNCTAELEIGAYDAALATSFFAGFYGLAFLACSALPDAHIIYLFNRTRLFFGV